MTDKKYIESEHPEHAVWFKLERAHARLMYYEIAGELATDEVVEQAMNELLKVCTPFELTPYAQQEAEEINRRIAERQTDFQTIH